VDLDRKLRIPASRSLFFQPLDSDPEPLPECRLQLLLRSRPVERIDRSSTIVQLNVAAGNISIAKILWCQLCKQAIAARLGRLRRIKIQAARRILKYKLRPPWRSRGVAISAFFQKIQFSLQHRQQITLVASHWKLPHVSMVAPMRCEVSDPGHEARCVTSPGNTRTVSVKVGYLPTENSAAILTGNFCRHARRLFAVLEELHLAQSFLRRFQGLVRSAKIFPLAGNYFVTRFNFFNHVNSPWILTRTRLTRGAVCRRARRMRDHVVDGCPLHTRSSGRNAAVSSLRIFNTS